MDFDWMECTPGKKNGSKLRSDVATSELANRAATLYRLGFSQKDAVARLCARTAWEYEPCSKPGGGCHRRPDELSDAAITKIVADTYARRPGGW
jgi:hypothetical protein